MHCGERTPLSFDMTEVWLCEGCHHAMISEFCEDCYERTLEAMDGVRESVKLCGSCDDILLKYVEDEVIN